LKSKVGWAEKICGYDNDDDEDSYSCVPGIPGTDNFGFAALPGGSRCYDDSSVGWEDCGFVDVNGYWWTATASSAGSASALKMWSIGENVDNIDYDIRYGSAVRCVAD